MVGSRFFRFFFFNDTATTEIYTLSLHDALPIWSGACAQAAAPLARAVDGVRDAALRERSEEHTSELQSQSNLVCRLLLEKKKKDEPRINSPCFSLRQQPLRKVKATDA